MIRMADDFSGGTTRQVLPAGFSGKNPTRDPWALHSTGTPAIYVQVAASFKSYLGFRDQLVDLNFYNWFSEESYGYENANDIIDKVLRYHVDGYVGFAVGEGFNRILRPLLGVKVPDAGFSNWYNTH